MKKCIKCGEVRPLLEFNLDDHYKDGHRGDCKLCQAIYARAHYQRYPPNPVTIPESGKVCRGCGNAKPAEGFYRDGRNRDGLKHKCRLCMAKIEWSKSDDQRRRIAELERFRRQHDPEYAKRQNDSNRASVKKHRDKANARAKMKHAIKRGRLVRLPCEVCGDAKSHGHHEDYAKPLDVVWLCQKHHMERHRKIAA
jgi:hypothetical protein